MLLMGEFKLVKTMGQQNQINTLINVYTNYHEAVGQQRLTTKGRLWWDGYDSFIVNQRFRA